MPQAEYSPIAQQANKLSNEFQRQTGSKLSAESSQSRRLEELDVHDLGNMEGQLKRTEIDQVLPAHTLDLHRLRQITAFKPKTGTNWIVSKQRGRSQSSQAHATGKSLKSPWTDTKLALQRCVRDISVHRSSEPDNSTLSK